MPAIGQGSGRPRRRYETPENRSPDFIQATWLNADSTWMTRPHPPTTILRWMKMVDEKSAIHPAECASAGLPSPHGRGAGGEGNANLIVSSFQLPGFASLYTAYRDHK
ncbi:hypothetical protein D9M68_764450 [compost metagenome]